MSASFLALYRGKSIGSAKLIAVSSDQPTVRDFAQRLLESKPPFADTQHDPVLLEVEHGRRRALHLIAREGEVTNAE